ncbi:hypothetical protein [uncultured Maribacter sp.]|uniref:hypothetical protein n=1 Tax=uncultured Maribacter sp. TaxID=431308 RepID=UPI00262AEEE3|nr:hypothetical protein [uncultured Maribacter sp.]
MKKFILNCIYFIIPFIVYVIIVLIINPYNYENFQCVQLPHKEKIAKSVEPHLFKIIDFENNPTSNILLGDSRSNSLALEIKSTKWSNLAYGGGSLKEVIETFWWAKDIVKLDTVLVGINLNLYNKYNKRFWVEETLELKKNIFSYAFSRHTSKATFLNIKSMFIEEEISLHKTKMSKDKFWRYQLNVTGPKFYTHFAYPTEYYRDLKEISQYCIKNDIKLIFWVPPTHIDFQKIKNDHNLEELDKKFISDLNTLGKVYNFDIDSNITRNADNFRDPMHFDREVGLMVFSDLFSNTNYLYD